MVRLGIVLDLDSGQTSDVPVRPNFVDETVVGRAPCRPFGITWTRDELFVANNRQLLAFDRDLNYSRTEKIPLQVNTHQLAYRSGRVWAASPWTNSLIGVPTDPDLEAVEFDLFRQALKSYITRDAPQTDDVNHINSLLWAGGYLFTAAHNLGKPSFILCYSGDSLRLEWIRYDLGFSIHGLAYCEQDLYWISTQTNEIRSLEGYKMTLPRSGFARGFAMTREHFIVATSEHRPRKDRIGGDSWIQVIDKASKNKVAEHHLRGTGSINDLRLLDQYDYAHCVGPLW